MQRAGGRAHNFGQGFPFGVPAAESALVFLACGEHGADQAGNAYRGGEDGRAGDGVALVRHGGGNAAACLRGFAHFGDFCLGVQGDVARDLSECAGEQAQGGGDFRHAVAMTVPGDLREREL